MSCPADVTVQTTGNGAEVILEIPKATNAVTPEPSVVLDPPSGLFAAGTTPVRVTATDAAGNVARCSFQVTVERVSPPSPPADVGSTQGPASTHGGCSQAGASGVTSLLVSWDSLFAEGDAQAADASRGVALTGWGHFACAASGAPCGRVDLASGGEPTPLVNY